MRSSSRSMSAASLAMRRRERRCSIASSSSLEAFSAATFSALSWRRTASISASRSAAGACRCAGRVGMMATNDAIMRASSGSFFASTPLALANCRSLNGLTWRTGKLGREQGTHDTTLVAAARLDPDRRDREAAQLLDQLGPAGGVITHRRALLLGQDHDVQTILRHIDTAKREHCHLRIPFLLMRARARATVRVWKKRLELQAHSRFMIRNGYGLPVATGARS